MVIVKIISNLKVDKPLSECSHFPDDAILMYYTPLIYSLDHPLLDLSDFLGLQGCPYN